MYGRVVVPRAVREELLCPAAPEMVRNWISRSTWPEVRSPVNAPEESLSSLDPGERDAIMLAAELRADQLMVDDRQGRIEAQKRGIPVMGTLGVLREAAILGLLDLRTAVKRLEATSFAAASEISSSG